VKKTFGYNTYEYHILYFDSLSVPLKIVPRTTLGTRAVGCRRLLYTYIREVLGFNLDGAPAVVTEVFFGFPQSLHKMSGWYLD
jgi:hypothetical protein